MRRWIATIGLAAVLAGCGPEPDRPRVVPASNPGGADAEAKGDAPATLAPRRIETH